MLTIPEGSTLSLPEGSTEIAEGFCTGNLLKNERDEPNTFKRREGRLLEAEIKAGAG